MLPRLRAAVARTSGARPSGARPSGARPSGARPSGARPSEASPAERLAGLLVPAGGWLPPATEEPGSWTDVQEEAAARWRDGQPQPWTGVQEDPAAGWPDGQPQPWTGVQEDPAAGWPDEQPQSADPADRWVPDGPDEEPADPAGARTQVRSWSQERAPAGSGPGHASPARTSEPPAQHTAQPGGRWRLDVGRSAVGALLLVAALAALLAAGVVLRGRPQEVAAPVVDARTAASAATDRAGAGHDGLPAVEATGVPLPGGAPGTGAAASGQVVVAVAGAVRTPGLVRLPAGSRVDDAVRAAGGPVDPAAVGLLNLARVLVDGEQVLVGVAPPGTVGGAAGAPGAPGAAGGPAAGGLLDLNVASAADLDGLPGIGPVLAQRIVDWRTEHGRFASVDQLREVTGIGEAKYQDLVEKVVV